MAKAEPSNIFKTFSKFSLYYNILHKFIFCFNVLNDFNIKYALIKNGYWVFLFFSYYCVISKCMLYFGQKKNLKALNKYIISVTRHKVYVLIRNGIYCSHYFSANIS